MNDERKVAALAPLVARVRTDVTAKLTEREGGKKGVSWTRTALDAETLARHCNGGPARGVALIKPGESVTLVACLDFDSHKGEVAWPEMAVLAGRVHDALTLAWGMEPAAFRSTGGRGVHIWLMWDEPQDAWTVRSWLADVLAGLGLKAGVASLAAGEVEVFPKQNDVAVGGYGNQVFLPLAGASEPLAFEDLSEMLVPVGVDEVTWRPSPPLAVRERPARPVARDLTVGGGLVAVDALRAPLDAISAAVAAGKVAGWGRNAWRDALFGIHQGTAGSEEGRVLAHEFSEAVPDYDAAEVDKVWDHAEAGREGGVGVGSLKWLARSVGWLDPADVPSADDFPLEAPADSGGTGEADGEEWPAFTRQKSGAILPTVDNAVKAVRRPDLVGVRIGHDLFRDELMVEQWQEGEATDAPAWRTMTDPDLVRLRIALERLRFKSVPKELARDAAVLVADEHQFDSALLWLRSLPAWDGKRRVESFLVDRWGAEDGAYVRAVARYMWTAMAGRVIDPGCQADMAVIFQGAQGLQKTSGVAAMAPGREAFVELDFGKDEAELARLMRGALVGEISELRGLHTKDHEGIKSFVSRRFEKWTPKYKEFATTFARRCVLFGTTNPAGVLSDDTGNRRWLPVHVERVDVAAIERDRDQLWAEAAAMFDGLAGLGGGEGGGGGVDWREAEALATRVHADYMVEDEWEVPIAAWLKGVAAFDSSGAARGESPFTVYEVLTEAIGLAGREVNIMTTKRAALILRGLGYVKANRRDESGHQRKVWVPATSVSTATPTLPLLLPVGECDLV